MIQAKYDVVIIGSGHNGLVAASYLSQAGKKVLMLEKNDYVGGATTSKKIFPEYEAHLSRYAYLVSLFPTKIKQDLKLNFRTKRRTTASFTPFKKNNKHFGLLLSNENDALNQLQINQLQSYEYERYLRLLTKQQYFAEQVWDSFLEPLRPKNHWEKQFETTEKKDIWKSLVEKPIGHFIEDNLTDDLLRGVVLTDAKIGVFASAHQQNLLQNRTYLYHIIGNKTGEWQVPVGGMGAVVESLFDCTKKSGVEVLTSVNISGLQLGNKHLVGFEHEGRAYDVTTDYILCNAAPDVLQKLLNKTPEIDLENEGSVMKMNLLLRKLPRLKADVNPTEAFAGTFHINQSYRQMEKSFEEANNQMIPAVLPFEIYCHTLTDSSILSDELVKDGYHTLTLFGLDVPYRLFKNNNSEITNQLKKSYLLAINQYLDEPIEDCIARNADGSLCVEIKSPLDLEKEIGLPQGNIFHTAPSWFFAENNEEIGSWGVETGYDRVYVCGSGAKRGGAVSGITGHNAAMKILC